MGRLQKECLLLGDFNVDPKQFRELSNSEFWRQCPVRSSLIRLELRFQLVSCGVTAHTSNPCTCGDYAAVVGGEWTGHLWHRRPEIYAKVGLYRRLKALKELTRA